MARTDGQAVRRAAFDIGSGSTKLVVADVVGTRVERVLFEQEVPVSFAIDWKRSPDGTLSAEVRAQGLSVLRQFLEICAAHAVTPSARCAVATEVFRKAANGGVFLEEVREQLGLAVDVVTQEVEAHLGFRTAVALQGCPAESAICWDSGGASFQITSLCPSAGALRSYVGALGSGNTTALLVESIQGRSFAACSTPNPVSAAEAGALLGHLRRALAPPAEWLRRSRVTAIGGQNSMFCVAAEALGAGSFGVPDVQRALDGVLGLTDEELLRRPFCQGDLKEPPGLVVPKICLLLGVMEHCGIDEVHFCPSIGSCHGLLISEERYAA